uniref:Uncharacterized protein n=1 Tax=Pseudo-nitzschia australis TaxID=44445 RepID=A0A7S4ASE2_9STRA
MTITQAVKNFVERTANSVSSTAATDRAAIPTACNDAVANNSDVNAGNRNFNNISTNDQSPRILACSVPPGPSVQSLQAKLIKARKRNDLMRSTEKGVDEHGYPLGEFRKGFFHQYKVKVIITSTFRISLQQATTILAGFMTDQLELDLKRNRRVNEGEIMQLEADLEADEWEKVGAD